MDESTGRRSLEEVRELRKQVGPWGREQFHEMNTAIQSTVLHVTRMDGKLNVIGAKLDASDAQRDRLDRSTTAIQAYLKELNGRTQTSETAITVATREITRLEKVVYGAVATVLMV